jgi:uncharacterized membrane protein YfcA
MGLGDLALTACAALVIGGLIGAIGIGGVLLTPWLTHVIGLPVRDAIVISSFAFIGTGLAALVISRRSLQGANSINWLLIFATAPGALLGAWALALIPVRLALGLLAVLTIAVGTRALLRRKGSQARQASAGPAPGFAVGGVTGFASALTGTGGPMVLVPIMVWQGAAMRDAILLGQAVQLPIAAMATAGNFYLGGVDVVAGAAIGLMLVPGAFLGHRLAGILPLVTLTRLVGVTLIAAGLSFIVKAAAG